MSKQGKQNRVPSFRSQMKRSLADLQSIMDARQSPLGDGRFTVRATTVTEPSNYHAADVQKIRKALNVSQGVFAKILGVSPALVRAWELGTRVPSPIARRLLDQVRANPASFIFLVQAFDTTRPSRVA